MCRDTGRGFGVVGVVRVDQLQGTLTLMKKAQENQRRG